MKGLTSFFEFLSRSVGSIQKFWASSLRLRVISIIVIGGVVGLGALGVVITSQIRSSIFEQATTSNVEQFSSEAAIAQERFSAVNAPTAGESQQVANDLVSGMYDPARGLLGAVLMRSSGQPASSTQLVEPVTAAASTLRNLVSPELRAQVGAEDSVAWQSVAIPIESAASQPGMVIGKAIRIPGAGNYELYAVYSFAVQEALLISTFRVLAFALVALILVISLLLAIVLRLVLRPIREASTGARQLAQGDFGARMKVYGSDELAQLAQSFNQMADSIESQFTRMERMSAVQTNFVSAVSHELRSPVTTIRMAGQLIYDKRGELAPALKRSAELQHDQLVNLDAMLSDLLEISRYDAGSMALVADRSDLREIVDKVVEMAQPLAQDNGVTVNVSSTGDTFAEVEPRRVERIVRNLVVNALEHAEGRPISIRVVGGTDAVAVEVRDHGVGLTDEQAAHVFDRFWRADRSRVRKTGGTGLGLTIAREDAGIHGGTLEATGVLGVGSTFLLTLPRHPGEPFTAPIKLAAPEPFVEELSPEPEVELADDAEVASDAELADDAALEVNAAEQPVTPAEISQEPEGPQAKGASTESSEVVQP